MRSPVLELSDRPSPGPVRSFMDRLIRAFGFESALVVIPFVLDTGGVTVTNAGTGAGTALATTRTVVDLEDAGLDHVRVVVYGANSAAGSVTVTVYDVTNSVQLASVTVTDATPAVFTGSWTAVTDVGGDRTLEVRVIGDGAFDPVLYTCALQGRTVQARH